MARKKGKKGTIPQFSLRDKLKERQETEEEYSWEEQVEEGKDAKQAIGEIFPFSSFIHMHKHLWEKTLGIFIFLSFIYLLSFFSFPGVLALRGMIFNAVSESTRTESMPQGIKEVFQGHNLVPFNLQEEEENVEEEGEDKGVTGEELQFDLPLEGSVAGKYGLRKDPFTEVSRMHYGIDLIGSPGNPVKAAASGEVEGIYQDPYHGLTVNIAHSQEYSTLYSGLEEAVVKEGEKVKRGSTLGFLKEEENPLLHFQLRKKEHPLDPQQYIFLNN
ncbi:MAG: M23 family metallopeptidase [Candidatus Syntrophonatronum acetioxidans]|uniref:M23 family metallopeptidase n=1 Tax=Candidatus Syntrophonatronum acetioxidans TaxID=1795816 RepID=A0A424YIF5_9FIRM|nr:MAG: M23 family metallopeptidase [Candidatus Syntrophonatronum acetioxidans]